MDFAARMNARIQENAGMNAVDPELDERLHLATSRVASFFLDMLENANELTVMSNSPSPKAATSKPSDQTVMCSMSKAIDVNSSRSQTITVFGVVGAPVAMTMEAFFQMLVSRDLDWRWPGDRCFFKPGGKIDKVDWLRVLLKRVKDNGDTLISVDFSRQDEQVAALIRDGEEFFVGIIEIPKDFDRIFVSYEEAPSEYSREAELLARSVSAVKWAIDGRCEFKEKERIDWRVFLGFLEERKEDGQGITS